MILPDFLTVAQIFPVHNGVLHTAADWCTFWHAPSSGMSCWIRASSLKISGMSVGAIYNPMSVQNWKCTTTCRQACKQSACQVAKTPRNQLRSLSLLMTIGPVCPSASLTEIGSIFCAFLKLSKFLLEIASSSRCSGMFHIVSSGMIKKEISVTSISHQKRQKELIFSSSKWP